MIVSIAVTHNCIIAAVQLFHPTGQEAKNRLPVNVVPLTLWFFITSRPAQSAAMPIFFYSVVQKQVFHPAGATHCPNNVKFGMGSRLPLLCAKFHVYRGSKVGIQPQKLSKFQISTINLPIRGDSFTVFLRHSQRLYAFKFVVWSLSGDKQQDISIFSRWGHFPQIFNCP